MKTTIETWLPLFPGFYGTIYEPDIEREISDVNSQRLQKGWHEVDFDKFDFDYTEYEHQVVNGFIKFIKNNFSKFVSSIELQQIRHPKEYNFANDSANIVITITKDNKKAIGQYLAKNMNAFKDYLRLKYTSRSGFISSYPNFPEGNTGFLSDNPLEHAHKLGSILEFIFRNENLEDGEFDLTIYYSIEAYLSCSNYYELTNKRFPRKAA